MVLTLAANIIVGSNLISGEPSSSSISYLANNVRESESDEQFSKLNSTRYKRNLMFNYSQGSGVLMLIRPER